MQSVIMNMLQLNFLLQMTEPPPLRSTRTSSDKQEVCHDIFDSVICFPMIWPWIDTTDPGPNIPMSPEDIATTFYLFSRRNQSHPAVLHLNDSNSLSKTSLSDGSPVKIIIHGYIGSIKTHWLKNMVGELLRYSDDNIIVIDWSAGANPPYPQAAANIRVVAIQLAHLIHYLNNRMDIPMSLIHVIGYSLGAHMAGLAGAYLKMKYSNSLTRITGLDPAGPYFIGTDPRRRLDPSDADFVDVIHTNNSPLFGFPISVGINNTIGHLDFYPNGAVGQPQCNGDWVCEHRRSSRLFIESIRQSCVFTAVVCSSYEDFKNGNCWGCQNDTCSSMGLKSTPLMNKPPLTRLYLMTAHSSPFCGQHYRITIRTSDSATAQNLGGEFAIIGLTLNGVRDSAEEIKLSEKSVYYEANSTYRRVILTTLVGEFSSMDVVFYFPSSVMNIFSWRIRGPSLHLKSIRVEQLTPAKSWKFCFKDEELKPNIKYRMDRNDLCN